VKIVGTENLPATMPDHASQLYSKNIQSLLGLMVDEEGNFKLDFEDEVIAGACITRDGEIVHEGARAAAGTGGAQQPATATPAAPAGGPSGDDGDQEA
jgi:H+-translocating NAD(P) transhydrogenase subunit alpha